MSTKKNKTYRDNLSFIITEKQLQELLIHGEPIEVAVINRGGNTIKITRPWSDNLGMGYGKYFDHYVTAIATYQGTTIMEAKIMMHAGGGGKIFFCFLDLELPVAR